MSTRYSKKLEDAADIYLRQFPFFASSKKFFTGFVFICFYSFFFICSLLLNVFFPLFLKVQCPNFLDIQNSWGKVMARNGLRLEHFCSKMILNCRGKKKSFFLTNLILLAGFFYLTVILVGGMSVINRAYPV